MFEFCLPKILTWAFGWLYTCTFAGWDRWTPLESGHHANAAALLKGLGKGS